MAGILAGTVVVADGWTGGTVVREGNNSTGTVVTDGTVVFVSIPRKSEGDLDSAITLLNLLTPLPRSAYPFGEQRCRPGDLNQHTYQIQAYPIESLRAGQ